jgi:exopolysaccharide/PEP-CTERM locus tyrosine autokinase
MSIVQDTLSKLHEQGTIRSPTHPHPPGTSLARAASAREGGRKPEHEIALPAPEVRFDQNTLRAAGLLPPESQVRELTEQFRHIKRPLIEHAKGREAHAGPAGHLILVTSAIAGEGKTFTSVNLAMSMAFEKDICVLLVDGDVAKPQISRLLGLESRPGLLDALRDPTLQVNSLVLPTDQPGLSVLPAGQPGEHMTELLASVRLQQILHLISDRNPHLIVLFDSPPLLLRTESVALAQALGQVVMVVRAGNTPQQLVLDAAQRLQAEKPVWVVLNQSLEKDESSKLYGQAAATQQNTNVTV